MNHKNIFAFFGVDGAGKTTVIEKIRKELEKEGRNIHVIRMNRAGDHKLPFIKTYVGLRAKFLSKKKNVKKYRGSVYVDIYRKRGLLFMAVYFLDLWLRFREAKKISKKKIVLMDRYFYDGIALSKGNYANFFSKLIPSVKGFFLYASPEIIHKRKKEATKQNIIDYKKSMEKYILSKFDVTKIKTEEPLRKNIHKIISIIETEINIDQKFIELLNKKKVDYAILRNYEYIEKEKDIDVLISETDGLKVNNVCHLYTGQTYVK